MSTCGVSMSTCGVSMSTCGVSMSTCGVSMSTCDVYVECGEVLRQGEMPELALHLAVCLGYDHHAVGLGPGVQDNPARYSYF
jgi:hypothetical protein